MKTLFKTLLIGAALGLTLSARAQFSFGFSYGGAGFGVGVGFNSGYYSPYCSSYPYYGYPYYSPYYYGYGCGAPCYYYQPYSSPVWYSPWTPVYASAAYYPWYTGCNPWWSVNGCWNSCGSWNSCWNRGWCGNWNGCWNGNSCWNGNGCWNGSGVWAGNWHGSGVAVTQPLNHQPIMGTQMSEVNRHVLPRATGSAATVAGGTSIMRSPRPISSTAMTGSQVSQMNQHVLPRTTVGMNPGANGSSMIRSPKGSGNPFVQSPTPTQGYQTIHSLAWSARQNTAVPQTGNGFVSSRAVSTPIKADRVYNVYQPYQPMRSTAWSANTANYNVPVRNVAPRTPMSSASYQTVQYSPAGNGVNRTFAPPSTGGNRYQQMPASTSWRSPGQAGQVGRAPVQSGSNRGFGFAPSGGVSRPAMSGGFSHAGSGFSGRSFGSSGGFGSFHR
jgi:hypothetical protein